MSHYRVGIVGAGAIADNVHLPVLLADPLIDVRWVTDQRPERAEALARAFRISARPIEGELDVDALLIATPLQGREQWLERCRSAGIAALVEKPFARTIAEHDRLAALLPSGRLTIGYQRRFFATNRFVGLAIDEGWFGPLQEIDHSEGGRATRAGPESYADLPIAEGGGLTLNLGCHALDLATYLTRATAAHVLDREIVWDGAVDRGIRATAELKSKTGPVRFRLSLSDLCQQRNTTLYRFERVELGVSTAPADTISLTSRNHAKPIAVGVSDGARDPYQAVHCEWRDLLNVLGSDKLPSGTPSSSRLTTSLLEELLA